MFVTVPSNYYAVLKHYTIQGYRVIALAVKTLSPHFTWTHIQQMTRDEVEANPELIGLLIMRNQLKKETIPAIRILHEAHIRTVMVTGDNLQTAVTVAKDCDMIDRVQRIIQVEAAIIPASIHGAQHLQVLYNDPLAMPEFIAGTVCCLINSPFIPFHPRENSIDNYHQPCRCEKCRMFTMETIALPWTALVSSYFAFTIRYCLTSVFIGVKSLLAWHPSTSNI